MRMAWWAGVVAGVSQFSVLGAFGYLAQSELTAESGYNGSGKLMGRWIWSPALQWVQDNSRSLWWRSNNVTQSFGRSGGGRKVLSLMASPKAKGCFHRASSQSGTLYPGYPFACCRGEA